MPSDFDSDRDLPSLVDLIKGEGLLSLFPNPLFFHHDVERDAIAVADQGGFIPSRRHFEEIVEEVLAWYAQVTDDDINLHNIQRLSRAPGGASERALKPRSPQAGEVYVVRADNGLFKIGRSLNATRRVRKLTVQLPYGIDLVHIIPTQDMVGLERHLHERFDAKRKRGEWFELTVEDVAWIAAYRDSAA